MEDLKKIQEFFSKPLEEGKQLDQVDFAKVVKAVEQTGHPVTVLLVPKWNEIEVLTGMNAPDNIIRDLSNAIDSLGYGRNDIIIAGDSSNLSRREYSDIRRVNGGAKDYFEEASKEEETEFHTKLDKLVHDTFGKRKGEMEEYNTGIYYKDEKTQDKTKEASKSALGKVKDFIKKVIKEEEITVDDATEFKINLKHLLDKHAIQKEDISDYEKEGADYDKMYSDYLYKMVKEVATEKGYSKFLVSKDNPKGETDGLTTATMNKILMNVIKDIEETIQLGKNLEEGKLCKAGEAYRKRRMAAGEKSSAYLSGRAVKVCKGQMSGKKKKKK